MRGRGNVPPQRSSQAGPKMSDLYISMIKDQERAQASRLRRIETYRRRNPVPEAEPREEEKLVEEVDIERQPQRLIGKRRQEIQEEEYDEDYAPPEKSVMTEIDLVDRSRRIQPYRFREEESLSDLKEDTKNIIVMTKRAFFALFGSKTSSNTKFFKVPRSEIKNHSVFNNQRMFEVVGGDHSETYMKEGSDIINTDVRESAKEEIRLLCSIHPKGVELASFINEDIDFIDYMVVESVEFFGGSSSHIELEMNFKVPPKANADIITTIVGDVRPENGMDQFNLLSSMTEMPIEEFIEESGIELLEINKETEAKGFRFRDYTWVPNYNMVQLANRFTVLSHNENEIELHMKNLEEDFQLMMRERRHAVEDIEMSMSRDVLCRMIAESTSQEIIEYSKHELLRTLDFGLLTPLNPTMFGAWKVSSSALGELRQIDRELLHSDPIHPFLRGTILDENGIPIIIDEGLPGTVRRRRFLALVTAIIYRLGKHSVAARWYETGRLSPLSLLILFFNIQEIIMLTALAAVEIAADDQITYAIIESKISTIFSERTAIFEVGALDKLFIDCKFGGVTNFDIIRGSDTTMYIAGLVINQICEFVAVDAEIETYKRWQYVESKLKDVVKRKGFKTIEQYLVSVDRPQNMNEINIEAPSASPMFQRFSSRRWLKIFSDFISQTTRYVANNTLETARNEYGGINREVGMNVVTIAGEVSSYRLIIEPIREAINREFMDIFTRGSFGDNFEHVNENIDHIRLFVGFEFNIYDVDNEGKNRVIHRSAGFEFKMMNFARPGPLHRNFEFLPTRLELHRKRYSGENAGQYTMVYDQELSVEEVKTGQFIEGAVVQAAQEMLHDELILDQMREAFTASGPDEEDFKALFEELHIYKDTESLEEELEITRERDKDRTRQNASEIYINQVTFMTAPVFENVLFPLVTSAPPRNPVVGGNDAYAESLLNEGRYDVIALKLLMTQFGMPPEKVELITCAVASAWFIMVWACDTYSDFVNMAFIRVRQGMEHTERLHDMIFWLEIARRFIKEILEQNLPIFIFFTSSCRVIEFSMAPGTNKYVEVLMSEQRMAFDYPVLVITGEFTAVAHAFITTAERLYSYVNYRANTKLRQNLDKFKSHRGFSLIRSEMYKNIMDPPVPVTEILEDVMDNVWALDIETYSAKGVEMEPYCIVIESMERVELQAFGQPSNVRALFRDFMENLEQRRNPKSESLTIYAHNGAKFDWVVLMKDLLELFPDMNVAGRITEAKFISVPSINLKLADFFLMVSSSLSDIAKEFETETQETSCEVIKDLDSVDNLTEFQEVQIMEYCINDCQCLLECVEKFTLKMLEVSEAERLVKPAFILPPTSSEVAQNIFAAKYLGITKLHGNLSPHVDQIEEEAYYGGITQVFSLKPQKNVHYIDVNSLYPAAMVDLKVSTHPAKPEDVEEFKWSLAERDDVDELEDHYLYDVELFCFKEDAFGMLPVRLEKGGLLYPRMNKTQIGDWRAGVELKALILSGMLEELNIKRLLRYPVATSTLFKYYIEDIYKEKAECMDGAEKTVYKLLLNQLYGKFAERTFDERILIRSEAFENNPQVVDKVCARELNLACLSDMMTEKNPENKSDIQKLYEQTGRCYSNNGRVPQLSCIHKVDDEGKWLELVITKDNSDMQTIGRLKRIAMMTTAKARAIMINALGLIYKELGDLCKHVYYMDTDSFFCSHDAYLVFEKSGLLSNTELGKFKDEVKAPNTIPNAQFYASKVYHYEKFNTETKSRELKCKFKGMKKGLFKNPDDCIKIYRDMMKPGEAHAVKQEKWSRSFGHIVIEDVLKQTVAKPRRLVLPDGDTKSFEFVDHFEEFTKNERVVLHDDGTFNYEEYE